MTINSHSNTNNNGTGKQQIALSAKRKYKTILQIIIIINRNPKYNQWNKMHVNEN